MQSSRRPRARSSAPALDDLSGQAIYFLGLIRSRNLGYVELGSVNAELAQELGAAGFLVIRVGYEPTVERDVLHLTLS